MNEGTSRPSPVLKPSHYTWLAVLLLVLLLAFNWVSVYPVVREVVLGTQRWYGQLFANLATPVQGQVQSAFPFVAPFLLGLLAATAPCQLSTGAASLAFVVHDPQPAGIARRASAFLLGRVTLFMLLGLIGLLVASGPIHAPGDLLTGLRRVLGPLMLVVGLVLLGVFRPRFAFGAKLSSKVQALGEARGGFIGAYTLGVALSLAFCPTLFFLFFGLTLPMAAASPLGWLYPAVFALGMSVPLLGLASLWLLSGREDKNSKHRRYLRGWRSWNRAGTYLAGVVMLIAGLQETFLYWLL